MDDDRMSFVTKSKSSSRNVSNFKALRGYLRRRASLSPSIKKTGPVLDVTSCVPPRALPPIVAILRAAFLDAAVPATVDFMALAAMTAAPAALNPRVGRPRLKCASKALFRSFESELVSVKTLSAPYLSTTASTNAPPGFLASVVLSLKPTDAKCAAPEHMASFTLIS